MLNFISCLIEIVSDLFDFIKEFVDRLDTQRRAKKMSDDMGVDRADSKRYFRHYWLYWALRKIIILGPCSLVVGTIRDAFLSVGNL